MPSFKRLNPVLLSVVSDTFMTANKILDEDVGAIVTDLRGAVGAFTVTMENASANIDVVSGEVLSASKAIAAMADAV